MDRQVWSQFAVIEARRIKERLSLPERGGLKALEIAFKNRLVSLLNNVEILRPDKKTLVVTIKPAGCSQHGKENRWLSFPANRSVLSNFLSLQEPLTH